MEKETLNVFYEDRFGQDRITSKSNDKSFNILRFDDCLNDKVIPYRKRDFFKVAFLKGSYIVHYADKSIEFSGSTLSFFNPEIPYSVDMPEGNSEGLYFIFKESYINEYFRHSIKSLPIFAVDYRPLYVLNEFQEKEVGDIFGKMKDVWDYDYVYKHDLIRIYILHLIHIAINIKPVETIYQVANANNRITAIFCELLDRQFPIDHPVEKIQLRTANDYANKIRIHVNHLNRALKITTGQTTTELIMLRILQEAKLLLKKSEWTIAEISYVLGFKDQANFNHFFKKSTMLIPSAFRKK